MNVRDIQKELNKLSHLEPDNHFGPKTFAVYTLFKNRLGRKYVDYVESRLKRKKVVTTIKRRSFNASSARQNGSVGNMSNKGKWLTRLNKNNWQSFTLQRGLFKGMNLFEAIIRNEFNKPAQDWMWIRANKGGKKEYYLSLGPSQFITKFKNSSGSRFLAILTGQEKSWNLSEKNKVRSILKRAYAIDPEFYIMAYSTIFWDTYVRRAVKWSIKHKVETPEGLFLVLDSYINSNGASLHPRFRKGMSRKNLVDAQLSKWKQLARDNPITHGPNLPEWKKRYKRNHTLV